MSTLHTPTHLELNRNRFDGPQQHKSDTFGFLSDRISKLSTDLGNLVSLRVDLLKAEARDGAKTLARDSALVIAGGIFGIAAFAVLTLAIIAFVAGALTMGTFMNWAVASLIVFAAYSVIAGVLVMLGIKHLQKKGIKPERSIEEVRRDKEWVREMK